MRRKKPVRFNLLKSKATLITVASVIGFFGSVWTLDQHWLPREIFSISIAQVNQSIGGLQKEMALSSARNEAFYWLRRENELKSLCVRDPKNPQLKQDLEQAIVERRRAEDEVRRLQEKR